MCFSGDIGNEGVKVSKLGRRENRVVNADPHIELTRKEHAGILHMIGSVIGIISVLLSPELCTHKSIFPEFIVEPVLLILFFPECTTHKGILPERVSLHISHFDGGRPE